MSLSIEEFWRMTESAFTTAPHMADKQVRGLARADLPSLRRTLSQYRYFTGYYTKDLALLISKMPPCRLRSALAGFLNEELGMGNPDHSHPKLWDRFLLGIGMEPEELERCADPNNIALLESMTLKMLTRSHAYGVGLRGMGAECLCQVYLTAMHHNLMQNPHILRIKDQIDWIFWDIHAGEIDVKHRETCREMISEMIQETPSLVDEMAEGYVEAKKMWDLFWNNSYALGLRSVAEPETLLAPVTKTAA